MTVIVRGGLRGGERAGDLRRPLPAVRGRGAAQSEFVPDLKASGSLLPGNARVQFLQEPSSRIRQAFHLKSFRPAVAWQEQKSTRRIPNVAKPTARPRKLTARGGNVSS